MALCRPGDQRKPGKPKSQPGYGSAACIINQPSKYWPMDPLQELNSGHPAKEIKQISENEQPNPHKCSKEAAGHQTTTLIIGIKIKPKLVHKGL